MENLQLKKKENEAEGAAVGCLERSVERLYEFLGSKGMIDWKPKVISQIPESIRTGSATAQDVALAAADIDRLVLRMMLKDEKDKRRAKKKRGGKGKG